jgi:septum formation protein
MTEPRGPTRSPRPTRAPGPPVALASASPRRRELIDLLGLDVVVRPPRLDEAAIGGDRPPAELVVWLAEAKARAAAPMWPDGRVRVGADTVVALDGVSLGKPDDRDDARRMLAAQSGRTVEVLTGTAVVAPNGGVRTELTRSEVDIRRLTGDEIAAYVATGAGDDKAGAIEVQERAADLVLDVRGCYTNVLGLPVCVVGRLLGMRDEHRPCPGPSGADCRLGPGRG